MNTDCGKPDTKATVVQPASPATVWRMDKSRDMKRLLLALCEQAAPDHLAFDARKPDHPGVVRIFDSRESGLAARVYTLGQEPGRYGIQLDYPELADNHPELVSDSREDLGLDRTLEILTLHFDLPLRKEDRP